MLSERVALTLIVSNLIISSSQTHVMQLIEELGLVVYPQYTKGKKVHHMGGPRAKISHYTSSMPSYSLLVLLDFVQFIWKVGVQTQLNVNTADHEMKNEC